MKFLCSYCLKAKTKTIFPNISMPNQEKIVNGIMVCDSHIQTGISKLVRSKLYKVGVND